MVGLYSIALDGLKRIDRVMKMFGVVFFACICFFFVYILLAGSPVERLNRACLPTTWLGRALTTSAAIGGGAGAESTMSEHADGLFNSCRFALYRQFYAQEHERLRRAAGKDAEVSE